MLPKFLIADNSSAAPEFVYVVHTESPRFIVGSHVSDFNYLQEVHWIDEKPEEIKVVNRLIKEAHIFWESEFEESEDFEDEIYEDDEY